MPAGSARENITSWKRNDMLSMDQPCPAKRGSSTPLSLLETLMKRTDLIAVTGSAALLAGLSFTAIADTGSITILAPHEGAVISSASPSKLDYSVHLSPTGNHLHVVVDDQNPIVVHKVSDCPCSMPLPPLSPGKHVIVIKEATAAHSPTGVEGRVTFTAK